MQLCQEEIELARQEAAEQVEVEGVRVVAGWEVIDLEPAPVGSVFALIVERGYRTKWELPATT